MSDGRVISRCGCLKQLLESIISTAVLALSVASFVQIGFAQVYDIVND